MSVAIPGLAQRSRGFAAIVSMALALGACRRAADTESVLSRSAAASTAPPAAGAAWSASTPSGAAVRVRPAASPLRAGANTFEVSIDPAPPPNVPVAIDLASPTMPLHGVTRFVARRTAPGRYSTHVDVPMEGRWILYVNVSSDTDTVSVAFDAFPAPASDSHARMAPAHRLHPMPGG